MNAQLATDLLYINQEPDSAEALQLKYHILSGEPDCWCVYIDSHLTDGYNRTFDDFEAANAFYDGVAKGHYAKLVLWTRIGTAVIFRMKGYEVIE